MDSNELLNALSDKLQAANKTVILQKRKQREQIEEKLQNIEVMFSGKKKFEADALEKAKFSVDKIAALSNQTVKNINLKTRKEEELVRNLKQQIENDLQASERDHQQKTQQIIERQTQKMSQIIDQLSKKAKQISQTNDRSLEQLRRTITGLERDLEQETEQRKNNCRQIEEDIAAEVGKFNAMIEREREHRVVAEGKIEGMIGEIRGKIQSELAAAANKRKKNNAALLKLIEGACQRLEQRINLVM